MADAILVKKKVALRAKESPGVSNEKQNNDDQHKIEKKKEIKLAMIVLAQ